MVSAGCGNGHDLAVRIGQFEGWEWAVAGEGPNVGAKRLERHPAGSVSDQSVFFAAANDAASLLMQEILRLRLASLALAPLDTLGMTFGVYQRQATSSATRPCAPSGSVGAPLNRPALTWFATRHGRIGSLARAERGSRPDIARLGDSCLPPNAAAGMSQFRGAFTCHPRMGGGRASAVATGARALRHTDGRAYTGKMDEANLGVAAR